LIEIHNKLTAVLKSIPEIRTVDLYNQQVKKLKEGKEVPFLFPAVFLEYSNITYKQEGAGTQKGELTVTIHIYANNFKDPVNEIFQLRAKVHRAIHGLRSENDTFSSLVRTGEDPPSSWDSILEWQMDYQATFVDNSSFVYREYTAPTDSFSVRISVK
jgi:hypothetical protein